MMTWKELKEELESQGLQNEIMISQIVVKADEKIIVNINEHFIAEVSSY
jgi:hypothetical protein